MLLAQAIIGGYSLVRLAITAIIIAAVVGIAYVALGVFGIQVPGWAKQIFWIVLCACVCIVAINFIAAL